MACCARGSEKEDGDITSRFVKVSYSVFTVVICGFPIQSTKLKLKHVEEVLNEIERSAELREKKHTVTGSN